MNLTSDIITTLSNINSLKKYISPAVERREERAALGKYQVRLQVHDGLPAEREPAAAMGQEVCLQELSEGELSSEIHIISLENLLDVILNKRRHVLPSHWLDQALVVEPPEVLGDRVVPSSEQVVIDDEVERHGLPADDHVVEGGDGDLSGNFQELRKL